MTSHYKSAYELGLDPLDLQLCLDTDMNQSNYDGSRQIEDNRLDGQEPPPETTTIQPETQSSGRKREIA
jgi:hypothetical protein